MPLALFDLDDTLIDREAAYRRWAESFVADQGGSEDGVAWLIEIDQVGFADRDRWAAAVHRHFDLQVDLADVRATLHAQYIEHYVADERTLEALTDLREEGWTIGVVTNGPPSQEDKIRRGRLDAYLDGWAVSDLVGARKPDRRIFDAAAAACGCELGGAWMIGDSAPADMAGGRAAGLGTIWMRRGRRWSDEAARPDPWIAALGLAPEPIPEGWAPDHIAEDINQAVELLLGRAGPASQRA